MSETYNKIDFIIIIILSLLVAFIIGFNIIQIVDNKLSSVTINVPTQNCNLPPIYLNIDSNSNIRQIKLNDVISTIENESQLNNNEQFDNISLNESNIEPNYNSIEKFGNINDYPNNHSNYIQNIISAQLNSNEGNEIINQSTKYDTDQNPNYNTLNQIPLLISPDTDNPNQASSTSNGYYTNKVKLIDNPNSQLLKLAKENLEKINSVVAKCALNDSKKIPEINGTFDGYNSFIDLKQDSYANITSIGKSMLTPYTSYPLPS